MLPNTIELVDLLQNAMQHAISGFNYHHHQHRLTTSVVTSLQELNMVLPTIIVLAFNSSFCREFSAILVICAP